MSALSREQARELQRLHDAVADVRRQSVAYGVSPSSQSVRLADLLAKLIEVAP